MEFSPEGFKTLTQMVTIIMIDVIKKYERGDLTDDEAQIELLRRLGAGGGDDGLD